MKSLFQKVIAALALAGPVAAPPWLAGLYLKGELMLDELISMRLPLERINEGFAGMQRGEVVRAVVQMNA
jgi:Zn-dependent alcohol dehydrogenase